MNKDLNNKSVAVVGLGISNLACITYLMRHDLKRLSVFDTRQNPLHVEELPLGLDINLGPLDANLLSQYDLIVVSPGLSLQTPELVALKDKVEIVGDIELFARELKATNSKAKLIGITGSNGKSTVTALTGHILNTQGYKTMVGANFGNAVFDILSDDIEVYVLELSSFELDTTSSLVLDACVILNVSEDHLDRYDGSLEKYAESKRRIFKNAKKIIVNRDDKRTIPLDGKYVASFGLDANDYGRVIENGTTYLCHKGKKIMDAKDLTIYGVHNELNALVSIALCDCLNVKRDVEVRAIKSFVGLDHRCQLVRTIDGVSFYNDSKATNVASTEAAIAGLCQKHKDGIILLAGGLGKGQDFSPLKKYLGREVSLMYCFGKDAKQLIALSPSHTKSVLNMRQALNAAFAHARAGQAILLSPACASFDQFKGYEERGRIFANMVLNLER